MGNASKRPLGASVTKAGDGYLSLGQQDDIEHGTDKDRREVQVRVQTSDPSQAVVESDSDEEESDSDPDVADWSCLDCSHPPKRAQDSRLNDHDNRYTMLFTKDRNENFVESRQLALRGAFILYLVGLPLILNLGGRAESDPLRMNFFYKNEFFNTGNIVIFIYTLSKTFGETVSNGCDALGGTLMACIWAGLLFGIFPEGVSTEGKEVFALWSGHACGVSFVFLVLFLNFRELTQVFALANWVYHWMAFMELDQQTAGIMKSTNVFSVELRFFAVEGLLVAVGGVTLAVAATLFPFPSPLLAIKQAPRRASLVVDGILSTWDSAAFYYNLDAHDAFFQQQLQMHLQDVEMQIASLKEDLKWVWWERTTFFFCAKWRRTHRFLCKLDQVTDQVYDRIQNVVDSCLREEFEEHHAMFSKSCKSAIEKAQKSASSLLRKTCLICTQGGIKSQEEARRLCEARKKVRRRMQQFTWSFIDMKYEPKLKYVSWELLDEHVFGLELCRYCKVVCRFSKHLIDEYKEANGENVVDKEERAFTVNESPSLLEVSDNSEDEEGLKRPLSTKLHHWTVSLAKKCCKTWRIFNGEDVRDPTHLHSCARNTSAILIGWYIGYFGYHKMILAYDAGIAGTAAVLVSTKYAGSGLIKNLGRLQGVVVGVVAGELVWALLGNCTWWGILALSFCFIVYVGGTLFTYYYSEQYSYIGCLMAAFGTSQFLRGCSDEILDPRKTFYNVINLVVYILIMGVVDSLLSQLPWLRPSKRAHEAFQEALTKSRELVQGALSQEPFTIRGQEEADRCKARIDKALENAISMASEAAAEPRLWRSPWKAELWRYGMRCPIARRSQRDCLMQFMKSGDWQGAAARIREFQNLREEVVEKFQHTSSLAQVFIADDLREDEKKKLAEIEFNPNYARKVNEQIKLLMDKINNDKVIQDMMEEANKRVLRSASKSSMGNEQSAEWTSLEDDPSAKLSLFLSCVWELIHDLKMFHFACLCPAGMSSCDWPGRTGRLSRNKSTTGKVRKVQSYAG